MVRYCLWALAGAYALTLVPALPSAGVAAVAVGFVALAARRRLLRPLAALIAGALLLWSASRAQLADRLAPQLSGNDITFDAEIIDFTVDRGAYSRLLVAPSPDAGLPSKVRVNWYSDQAAPRLGERWRLTARLRRPRGFANPGGFDYEGWLFAERIGATGYVVAGEPLVAASGKTAVTARLRRDFVARVDRLLPRDDAAAVLLAITVGARHRVTREAWERYARTGTTHLMAISGLHVGLAAGAAFAAARLLLALFLPRANSRDPALALAVLAAGGYAAVSGFAIPARRALLMALVTAVAVLSRRRLSPYRVLAVAAMATVVADPLSLLAPGFKLSFAAVAVLLYVGLQRRPGQTVEAPDAATTVITAVRQLGRVQGALLIGLLPLTVLLFGRTSWLAPAANLLVLPVFSLLTVPAALAGMLAAGPLSALGDAALWTAWYSLRAMLRVLETLAGLPGAGAKPAAPAGLAILATCLAALWVVLPRGLPGRRLALPALAAALLYRPAPPPAGCVDLTVLDVGQGLAAVVRTSRHTLVFDTGPAFGGGSDTAELVLLPYLGSLGIRRVDVAVISHADRDHAGGVDSLVDGVAVRQVLAGEPGGRLPVPELPCTAGTRWRFDGVEFAVLHPEGGTGRDGNDASCVLEVTAGTHRLLLTGDIEKHAEARLVGDRRVRQSAVVVVPHHGSRTSSTPAFVRATAPGLAIVAAGYGNRWGFPKEDVVARWTKAGATVVSTAENGAVEVRACKASGVTRIVYWRERLRRYWHD